MYICPFCNKQFNKDVDVAKHSLKCWRELNPNHKSKDAPRSEDIVTRKDNNDILNFFATLQKGK